MSFGDELVGWRSLLSELIKKILEEIIALAATKLRAKEGLL